MLIDEEVRRFQRQLEHRYHTAKRRANQENQKLQLLEQSLETFKSQIGWRERFLGCAGCVLGGNKKLAVEYRNLRRQIFSQSKLVYQANRSESDAELECLMSAQRYLRQHDQEFCRLERQLESLLKIRREIKQEQKRLDYLESLGPHPGYMVDPIQAESAELDEMNEACEIADLKQLIPVLRRREAALQPVETQFYAKIAELRQACR